MEKRISRRSFLEGLVGVAGIAVASKLLSACGDSGGSKTQSKPIADVGVNFGNGYSGKVTYLLTGSCEYGNVSRVSASLNGHDYKDFENGTSISIPIELGTNTINVVAYDEKGMASEPFVYSFESPTEAEAREVIEGVLEARNDKHTGYLIGETDYVAPTDPSPDNFHTIDYNIDIGNLADGDAIIEYVSHTDDLSQENLDRQYLNSYGVPNRYLTRLPLEEIDSRLNDWIDNNWQ